MDTYSSFYRGIIIPAVSAVTLTATGTSQFDMQPSNENMYVKTPISIDYHLPYSYAQESDSNKTIEINTDFTDLLTIESFAKKMLNGMTPIPKSIQAVIDDYFWEML